MCARRAGHGGFTLIEILIVITIIAILALIVVPRLYIPVDNAKRSTMQHNQRVIQHALEVFRADTGVYPDALTDLTRGTLGELSAETRALPEFVPAGFAGPYLVVNKDDVESLPRNPYIGRTSDDVDKHWTYDGDGNVASAF